MNLLESVPIAKWYAKYLAYHFWENSIPFSEVRIRFGLVAKVNFYRSRGGESLLQAQKTAQTLAFAFRIQHKLVSLFDIFLKGGRGQNRNREEEELAI